ncbi:MAG: cbb3-type cytochrome oxidase assembly protein CcoS [Alphaproteobacteria bacterium]|nr:cbb3-type cytochrome oxidase assembly protein CcoS [Alphaproteobacteria bacterium]
MNALVILIPAALVLGIGALVVFMWTLRSNQYEDLDGAAWRIIENDNENDAA